MAEARDWTIPPNVKTEAPPSAGIDWSKPRKSGNDTELTDDEAGQAVIQKILSNKPMERRDDREAYLKFIPNAVTGLAQAGHGLLNAPHNIANAMNHEWGNKIPKLHPKEYDYAKMLGLPDNASIADKAIRAFFQQTPAIFAPELSLGKIGKALESVKYGGKLAKSLLGKGLPISAYEATQSENPGESATKTFGSMAPFITASHFIANQNPFVSMAARAAAAGIGGYAGYEGAKGLGSDSITANAAAALAGGLLSQIPGHPETVARDTMLKGVNPEIAEKKLAASRRLGLDYMTPGEAGGNPFVAGAQGATGKTQEGAQLYFDRGMKRMDSEKRAIQSLKDTIYDPKTQNPIKAALYKSAYTKDEPQTFIDNLKQSKIMQEAFKKVEKEPAYQDELNGIPETNYAHLDQVNRALNDMRIAAKKAGEGNKARIIKNKQKEMLKVLDVNNPDFKEARGLAERQIARRDKIEKALNENDIRGRSFFDKVIKNDDKRAKLRASLKNVPEAQQKLDDMYEVFGDLINPPTKLTYHGYTKNGMDQARNTKKDFLTTIRETLSGHKMDEAAVNLMTNPKWDEELKNVGKLSPGREKASAAADLLGKAVGITMGQRNSEKQKPEVTSKPKIFRGYQSGRNGEAPLLHMELNTAKGYQQ